MGLNAETLVSEDAGAVIDRFYAAMTRGDVAGARACCTPDALFWHCFDGLAQDLETASGSWGDVAAAFVELDTLDVRRSRIEDGRFLHRQLFTGRRASGARIGWAVCLIIEVRDGRIARLDEYIDRAGAFTLPDGNVSTPGLG